MEEERRRFRKSVSEVDLSYPLQTATLAKAQDALTASRTPGARFRSVLA